MRNKWRMHDEGKETEEEKDASTAARGALRLRCGAGGQYLAAFRYISGI